MFQHPSFRFASNTSCYLAISSPLRGSVMLMSLSPTPETEKLSQAPVLFYEMDFVDLSQKLILGLN